MPDYRADMGILGNRMWSLASAVKQAEWLLPHVSAERSATALRESADRMDALAANLRDLADRLTPVKAD